MGYAGVPLTSAEISEILRREALGEKPSAIGPAIGRSRQTVDCFLQRHHRQVLGLSRVCRKRAMEPTHVGLAPDDPGEPSTDYQSETRGWIIAQDLAFTTAMARAHPELLKR